MRIAKSQTVCEWVKVAPMEPVPGSKLGLALQTLGAVLVNGLRVAPTDTTNGWYIWCGQEMSLEPDFFSPLHVEHIAEYLPAVAEYLSLPPGYRFLIDGSNYEDVWFDEQLLREAPRA